MSTVYIVDDSEADRETIADILKKSWKEEGLTVRPEVEEREFVWELLEKDDLQRGDIVIADLYPTEYWEKVPTPGPERREPQPKDPTNFYNAAVDMTVRFLREIPGRGAELIVMTYIPHFIERELEAREAAEELRAFLKEKGLTFFEKETQYQDEACIRKAVEAANEVLGK